MIYEALDTWNSPSLEHHGVKGMKWGVRKKIQSLGNRYSKWGRSVSNKHYDRMISKIEARRAKKMREFDSFDNARSKLSAGAQRMSNFVKSHKKEIAIGAGIAVGAVAAVGAYKVGAIRRNNEIAVGKFISDNALKIGSNMSTHEERLNNGRKIQTFVRDTTSVKKSILGPTLNYERRITNRFPTSKSGPMKHVTSVINRTVGRNGEYDISIPKDKNFRKYYRNIYKQYGR